MLLADAVAAAAAMSAAAVNASASAAAVAGVNLTAEPAAVATAGAPTSCAVSAGNYRRTAAHLAANCPSESCVNWKRTSSTKVPWGKASLLG